MAKVLGENQIKIRTVGGLVVTCDTLASVQKAKKSRCDAIVTCDTSGLANLVQSRSIICQTPLSQLLDLSVGESPDSGLVLGIEIIHVIVHDGHK